MYAAINESEFALEERFTKFYSAFAADKLSSVHEIYSENVKFRDPVHEISGIGALERYFANMAEGLIECRFVFYQRHFPRPVPGQADQQGFCTWIMEFAHPKLRNGQLLSLRGATHLRYSDRISYHEDFYDMGAMLYENVPLLGSVVRGLKQRLAG